MDSSTAAEASPNSMYPARPPHSPRASTTRGRSSVGTIIPPTLPPHGFLDTGGSFTQIDVPPVNSANAHGINGAAQIVGGVFTSGFLYNAGNFTFISAGLSTSASGINDAGQIVGSYTNSVHGLFWHGFLDTAGNITTFDFPGANSTFANGINGSGQIVGSYSNNTDTHGFLDTGGSFTQIDVPGATSTEASGINDAGQIVGSFTNSTGTHGFLDTGGSFIQIDVPGATSTEASGINDAGQIVGSTFVSGGTGDPHFTTFSGVNYDFQGVGDFLLARSNLAGDQFDVEIRTGAWSNATSVIEGAAATLCNHQVTFDVDRAATGSSLIWLDGSPISLSVGGPGLALGACKIFEIFFDAVSARLGYWRDAGHYRLRDFACGIIPAFVD